MIEDAVEFELSILGPLEAYGDGRRIAIGRPLDRALLAVLGLHAGERMPAEALLAMLWGDEPPPSARASLHNAVSRLRKALGPDVLVTRGGGYALAIAPDAVDARRFETMVEEARELLPAARVTRLLKALALWRGTPLAEFASPAVEEAVVRLEEIRLHAIEERLDAELELGRHEHILPELEALVVRHPLRESFWQRLILALYRSGRQAEALAAYRQAHRYLLEEIGIEPGRRLKELQRMVLVQDRSLELGAGPSPDLLVRATGLLPISPRERARAFYDYAVSLWWLGERERSVAVLETAIERALKAGDQPLAERARLQLGRYRLSTESASIEELLVRAREAARQFRESGHVPDAAQALHLLGQQLRDSGRCTEAAAALEESLALTRTTDNRWEEAATASALAFTLAHGPMPAREALAKCRALLSEIDTEPAPVGLWCGMAFLLAILARKDEADAVLELARETCRARGFLGLLASAHGATASLHLLVGDLESAERECRTADEMLDALGDRGYRSELSGRHAYVFARLGRLEEAEEQIARSRSLASQDDLTAQVALRSAILWLELGRGRPAKAVAAGEEAAALTETSDRLCLHAGVLEDLAAAHLAAGDEELMIRTLEAAEAAYEHKENLVGLKRVRALL